MSYKGKSEVIWDSGRTALYPVPFRRDFTAFTDSWEEEKGLGAPLQEARGSLQETLTLITLLGALFWLRFLILTVSWWAVLQVTRYLLIRGLGNSVPSKCFSPKASRLREKQRYNLTSQTFLQKSSPIRSCFTSPFYTFRYLEYWVL